MRNKTMCLSYIKVKLRKEDGRYKSKYAYVPCGKCVECRKAKSAEWQFRLNAEFIELKKRGWNIAFMTLTYDELHLPHIPQALFKNKEEYKSIPCFSRTDVRDFIDRIRQYCKYHYRFVGSDSIKYFVASEYGSTTHRPHYHAVLAWPQSVSYEFMHKLCSECWQHGYLFPRKPEGDYNSSTKKRIRSFKIEGDVVPALRYVAKYVTKDIDFVNVLTTLNLKKQTKLYKKIQPFHIQSRSFGYELLRNMSNDEKYNLLENGHAFQGDGFVYKCPSYIREKILFFNEYLINSVGRRKVYRRPTDFMCKYREYLFDRKSKWYDKVFYNVCDKNYFVSAGFSSQKAEQFVEVVTQLRDQCIANCQSNGFDFNKFSLGNYATTYDGVANEWIFAAKDKDELMTLWFNRYVKPEEWKVTGRFITLFYSELFKHFVEYAQAINAICSDAGLDKKEALDAKIREMQDYFNNVIK